MKVNKYILTLGALWVVGLSALSGCVIPQFPALRPAPAVVRPTVDQNGHPSYARDLVNIQLKDAVDGRAIDDARAIVLVHRDQHLGFCCSGRSLGEREPAVHLERFSRLSELRYYDFNLFVLLPPFYIGDTMPRHTYVSLIICAPGHLPFLFQPPECSTFTTTLTLSLQRGDVEQSHAALVAAVGRALSADEEYNYGARIQDRVRRLINDAEKETRNVSFAKS
jgi:hypothetical protein